MKALKDSNRIAKISCYLDKMFAPDLLPVCTPGRYHRLQTAMTRAFGLLSCVVLNAGFAGPQRPPMLVRSL
jgi:hypothetical protein